jgi:hypothetical protein
VKILLPEAVCQNTGSVRVIVLFCDWRSTEVLSRTHQVLVSACNFLCPREKNWTSTSDCLFRSDQIALLFTWGLLGLREGIKQLNVCVDLFTAVLCTVYPGKFWWYIVVEKGNWSCTCPRFFSSESVALDLVDLGLGLLLPSYKKLIATLCCVLDRFSLGGRDQFLFTSAFLLSLEHRDCLPLSAVLPEIYSRDGEF